jgi:hypothetical protein
MNLNGKVLNFFTLIYLIFFEKKAKDVLGSADTIS